MPFIQLELGDPEAGAALAPRLAAEVAGALGLEPADVLVSVSPRISLSDGTGPLDGWPAAIVHGRRRDGDAMNAATEVARRLLADALGESPQRVWVHWCTG